MQLTMNDIQPGVRLRLTSAPEWITDTYKKPEARIGAGEVFSVLKECTFAHSGCKEGAKPVVSTEREKNNLTFHLTPEDLALFELVN